MINHCLRCGYSLVDLPPEHRCPECGLHYERDSEVFRHRRTLWNAWDAIGEAVFGLMGVAVIAVFIGGVLGGILAVLALIILTVRVLHLWRGPRETITVSRNAVRVLGRSADVETYRIGDIRNATWNWVTGFVTIIGTDGRPLTTIYYPITGSMRNASRLAAKITEYAQGLSATQTPSV